MTDTARIIYETVPLGAIVRFSDGTPRPPERFNKKLSTWKNSNSSGRLTAKSPHGFTLHEGDIGSRAVIVMKVYRSFSIGSALTFTVESVPQPGQYLVLTHFAGSDELQRVADSREEAERCLGRHQYSQARIEAVGAERDTLPLTIAA